MFGTQKVKKVLGRYKTSNSPFVKAGRNVLLACKSLFEGTVVVMSCGRSLSPEAQKEMGVEIGHN